jgi:hypothetical protein
MKSLVIDRQKTCFSRVLNEIYNNADYISQIGIEILVIDMQRIYWARA